MRAELKGIVSTEFSHSINDFFPENPEDSGIAIQLLVGPEGEDSSETFDLLICSPDWIKTEYGEQGYTWGINMLIVPEYNIVLIRGAIEKYLAHCVGKSWMDVARQVSKIGGWEFEDYQPIIE